MLANSRKIEINFNSKVLLYAFIFAIIALVFIFLRSILVMLFIAFILNTGLRPLVNKLESYGIPRGLSIAVIYIGIFTVLILVSILMANEFISQVDNFIRVIPEISANAIGYIDKHIPVLSRLLPLDNLQKEISSYSVDARKSSIFKELLQRENVLVIVSSAYGIFGSVAEIILKIIAVIVVSGYMLQRKASYYEEFLVYFSKNHRETLKRTLNRIETNLGSWLLGQFTLMLITGVFAYFAATVPGWFLSSSSYRLDEYAIPIAILAGLMEAIPNIGSLFTVAVLSLLALGTSSVLAVVYVLVIFVGFYQVQLNFIGPQVMRRAVGIDPIITILAIIAAFQLFGVLGAALVVPVLAIVKIIISEFIQTYYPQYSRQSTQG